MVESFPLPLLHQLLLLQGCQTQRNSSMKYKLFSARTEFIVRSVICEKKLIIFLRRHQASPCPRFYRYSWMSSVSSAYALIWATFKVADLYFLGAHLNSCCYNSGIVQLNCSYTPFHLKGEKCLQSTLVETFSQDDVCKAVYSF